MPLPSPPARLAAPAAVLLLLLLLAATASAANFTCASPPGTTCQSAIGYRVRNATTYGALVSRFNTTTLADLLGANDLPSTTPSSSRVPANATVRIPFTCLCAGNGVGQSDHHPIYTVQPQDGLDAIARNVFDAFVTYQEIATANNITNVNLIDVGQKLWIPLPCSCDQVLDADVMHFAHIVGGGETTSGIAATFGVSESTLLRINSIADPKSLLKDQILDVPLPGNLSASVLLCSVLFFLMSHKQLLEINACSLLIEEKEHVVTVIVSYSQKKIAIVLATLRVSEL
jgi:chitin elicitor-binding protein